MSYISQLQLHHFRCYEQARLESLSSGLIVLCGPNGAGKTNLLEAVSLLTPGRGLRSAQVMEAQRNDSSSAWAISAQVETGVGPVTLGTGLNPEKGNRQVRINGVSAKNQAALSDYLSCIWLTPQMDRLFLEGPSGRRRFLDRLIFSYDPGHSGRTTRYENAMRQRAKLLQEPSYDTTWLKGLESQMAETGIAIAHARLDFISRLQKACDKAGAEEETFFPKAKLGMTGTLEELLKTSPAVEVEELFSYQLEQSRRQDADKGGAATGPHKSDLTVRYAAKDMPADQCSTGEQKALLVGIILAHARLMIADRDAPPVLLLDEIAAHLDENRRAALFDLLIALGDQVWMTGTDLSLFSAIAEKAQFFAIESARISQIKQGLAA